jgi:hypothetical protein
VLSAVLIKLLSYAPAIARLSLLSCFSPCWSSITKAGSSLTKPAAAFQLAGISALAAFFLKLLVAPIAIALLGGAPFAWRFDPLDIALMVFASSVLMIGGVLDAAVASLKAENDQIV